MEANWFSACLQKIQSHHSWHFISILNHMARKQRLFHLIILSGFVNGITAIIRCQQIISSALSHTISKSNISHKMKLKINWCNRIPLPQASWGITSVNRFELVYTDLNSIRPVCVSSSCMSCCVIGCENRWTRTVLRNPHNHTQKYTHKNKCTTLMSLWTGPQLHNSIYA